MVLGACSESIDLEHSDMPTAIDFVNGGECPPAPTGDFPGEAGCWSQVGTVRQTLAVYAIVGPDSRPIRWRIRYESGETTIDRALKAGNPFSYPRAIGMVDVDEDGTNEWLIKNVDLAGHGTNWQRLQLFVTDGDLVPMTHEGDVLYVNVGGTSRMGEGARCEKDRFVLLRTEAQDRQNTMWSYSERVLEIEGAEASLVTRREGKLSLTDYNDPKLDPYYRLECGDLVYP